MLPINHVVPTLAKRDTWKRMVGITLAYAGLVELRALDQHRTNGWQWSWPDEQNDIGLTSFVDVGPTKLPTKCQRWPNNWLLSGIRLVGTLPSLGARSFYWSYVFSGMYTLRLSNWISSPTPSPRPNGFKRFWCTCDEIATYNWKRTIIQKFWETNIRDGMNTFIILHYEFITFDSK